MQRLRQNLAFKILSLGCAFALFLYVRKQQATESPEYSVPLELTAPPGLRVIDPPGPRQVRVKLQGPAEQIRPLDETQIKALVDLSGQRKGAHPNLPVLIALPEAVQTQVQILYSVPSRINVRLDEYIEREIPVEPVLRTQLPPGYTLGLPKVQPARVKVSGLAEVVTRIKSAQASITVINSGEPVLDQFARVSVIDEQGQEVGDGLQISPPTVRVRAPLERSILARPVYVDPDLGPVPAGMRLRRLSVTPQRVVATGPDEALARLWVVRTRRIPLSPQATRIDQQVLLEVPPGIRRLSPATVRVEIELEGVAS